jgi:intermediate peptidase
LEDLAASRHQLAKSLGFDSYGHLATNDTLAGSPDAVQEFLREMTMNLSSKAEDEMELLRRAQGRLFPSRNHRTGEGDEGEGGEGGEPRVERWARGFLRAYLKAEQSRVSSPDLKNYFSVPGCIEGISMVSMV